MRYQDQRRRVRFGRNPHRGEYLDRR